MSRSSSLFMRKVRLGTLNVNTRMRNVPVFAQLALEHDLDVFCLNECTRAMARKIGFELGAEYEMIYAEATFAGNALFSRLPLKGSSQFVAGVADGGAGGEARSAALAVLSVDLQSADSTPSGTDMFNTPPSVLVELRVLATHLSHIHEKDRLFQMNHFLSESIAPDVIMGDLNALRRADYSTERWDEISDQRRRNKWVLPESELMDQLLGPSCYSDALQPGDGAVDRTASPLSTCRFDTRIDWILLRSDSTDALGTRDGDVDIHFEKDSYSVEDTMHITDHNLVTSTIVLTSRTTTTSTTTAGVEEEE